MSAVMGIRRLGRLLTDSILVLGRLAIFLGSIVQRSSILLARPRLTVQQVHRIGNLSLLIITVSGLFVGFVLGLQGYYTLNRYGSEEALGLLVAWPWCVNWGQWLPRFCMRGARAPR